MGLPHLVFMLLLAGGEPPPVPDIYRDELPRHTRPWSPEMALLGKQLFGEPRLSRNGRLSCQSCHDPAHAFAEPRARAEGVEGRRGARNTPTLVNRALGRLQLWDGRAGSLEEQALGPIANPREMDLPLVQAVTRLRADPRYRERFRAVFGGPPTARRLAAALAAYERTVFSVDSPFDRFLAGQEDALSPSARRGLALFGGKARCGECHVGPNFTDEAFHVLGVSGADPGRGAVSGRRGERGAFKTPTLREVARTAPYMHDGSLATLAEVVAFYDRGCNPHPNLDARIRPLGLTAAEQADLVAFLESLSGTVVDVSGPLSAPVATPSP